MSTSKRKRVYDVKESNKWLDLEGSHIRLTDVTPFTIGQSYTTRRAAKYVCRDCGADKLYVGKEDYLTVVMCPTCGWEEIVHDG